MRLIFILLFIPVFMSAQELKKVTQNDKESGCVEIFYVLKSNPKIKHGSYQKLYNGRILTTGFYNNGKEDSLWVNYTWSGKIESKGNYTGGNKTGIWEYYDYDGQIDQKYNYDKKEMVYNHIQDKAKPVFTLLIAPGPADSITGPMYIGGDYTIIKSLQYNIRYPQASRDNDVQGKVIISFTIDAAGNTSNYKIEKGVADDLDAEALRVTKIIPANWIPAKLNGKAVDSRYTMPIVFKLQ